MTALQHVMLVCVVALFGQSGPPPQRPRPPDGGQAESIYGRPDVVSLDNIRKALRRGEWVDPGIFPVGLPPLPPPPADLQFKPDESVATFRVEIVGPRMLSFRED